MDAEIVIDRRFNGPADSGNGGYTCGRIAALLDGPTQVTLRSPPPLERPLAMERRDGGVEVRDGATLVAEARPVDVDLAVPEPIGLDAAERASRAGFERWASHHPFPTCFVCGPDRADGLEIFPGRVGGPAGGEVFAATWTPGEWMVGQGGAVDPEYVWAALDCPTSAPVVDFGPGPACVLARLAARLERPVETERPHVIISWATGREGRKRTAGSAIATADGELLARAHALWIELRESPGDASAPGGATSPGGPADPDR